MNELLILTAMVSLLLMMLNLRKNTITRPIKALFCTILFIISVMCFTGVYGFIGGVICTIAGAMVAGLLTAIIAGKAPQLLD
ncbi:hypothetical protein I6F65_00635 [Pseudoalteromonas sp. SWXJZ94C]|uniref:hypothetical protein n=1 Tax=unclassified Pseudoalteromonas TaxID=194690 RepID=UPI000423D6EA|nr:MULTISPECIES: hypothetical protein [unclassified Pseudoalteromonas]MBH0055461.1 hypothetical protein [Pseudoalteromonas sp. SWXJZ94C]